MSNSKEQILAPSISMHHLLENQDTLLDSVLNLKDASYKM